MPMIEKTNPEWINKMDLMLKQIKEEKEASSSQAPTNGETITRS